MKRTQSRLEFTYKPRASRPNWPDCMTESSIRIAAPPVDNAAIRALIDSLRSTRHRETLRAVGFQGTGRRRCWRLTALPRNGRPLPSARRPRRRITSRAFQRVRCWTIRCETAVRWCRDHRIGVIQPLQEGPVQSDRPWPGIRGALNRRRMVGVSPDALSRSTFVNPAMAI